MICFDMNAFYFNSNGDEDIVPLFTAKIRREMMREFPEADIEEEDALEDCIAKAYMQTGEQFVLIIDEYDVLVREQVKATIFNTFLRFLNGMFKNISLSPVFALVYITGILPVVRDKIQSKLNMFWEYSMVDAGPFTEFTGFTEDEVKALCNENNMDFAECKRWYDGYRLNDYSLYNPRSVVTAMMYKKNGGYWTQTGSYDALKIYILMDFEGIRDDVLAMIAGGKVSVNVTKYMNTMTDFYSKDDVFTYLIHLGYLAYDQKNAKCYIPNQEIRGEWINSIENSPDYAQAIRIVKRSEDLLDLTINGDEAAVAQAPERFARRVVLQFAIQQRRLFPKRYSAGLFLCKHALYRRERNAWRQRIRRYCIHSLYSQHSRDDRRTQAQQHDRNRAHTNRE